MPLFVDAGELKNIKEKHTFSREVLRIVIISISNDQYLKRGKNPDPTPFEDDFDIGQISPSSEDIGRIEPINQEKRETSILIAARNGITELVEELLKRFPTVIHDETSGGKNILLVAVESRQPQVYQLLFNKKLLKDRMFQKLDDEGNNALHLAAKLGMNMPWVIPGAAMQMQREIKWYEV